MLRALLFLTVWQLADLQNVPHSRFDHVTFLDDSDFENCTVEATTTFSTLLPTTTLITTLTPTTMDSTTMSITSEQPDVSSSDSPSSVDSTDPSSTSADTSSPSSTPSPVETTAVISTTPESTPALTVTEGSTELSDTSSSVYSSPETTEQTSTSEMSTSHSSTSPETSGIVISSTVTASTTLTTDSATMPSFSSLSPTPTELPSSSSSSSSTASTETTTSATQRAETTSPSQSSMTSTTTTTATTSPESTIATGTTARATDAGPSSSSTHMSVLTTVTEGITIGTSSTISSTTTQDSTAFSTDGLATSTSMDSSSMIQTPEYSPTSSENPTVSSTSITPSSSSTVPSSSTTLLETSSSMSSTEAAVSDVASTVEKEKLIMVTTEEQQSSGLVPETSAPSSSASSQETSPAATSSTSVEISSIASWSTESGTSQGVETTEDVISTTTELLTAEPSSTIDLFTIGKTSTDISSPGFEDTTSSATSHFETVPSDSLPSTSTMEFASTSQTDESSSLVSTTGQESLGTAPWSSLPTLKDILEGRRDETPVPKPTVSEKPTTVTSTTKAETSQEEMELTTPIVSSSEKTKEITADTQQTTQGIPSGRKIVINPPHQPAPAPIGSTSISAGKMEQTELSTEQSSTSGLDTTVSSDATTSVDKSVATTSTEKTDVTKAPLVEQGVTTMVTGGTEESSETTLGQKTTLFDGITSSESTTEKIETTIGGSTSTVDIQSSPPSTIDLTTVETSTSPSSTIYSTTASSTTVETSTVQPSSTGPGTSESKTTSGSPSTIQELKMPSVPFTSTASSTTEESLPTTVPPTSSSFTTANERSGTSSSASIGTTSGSTTLSPQKYGQGCDDRCPEGSLAGSGRCYQLAPANYQPSFHLSFSWCGRDRVGHLIEKEELMEDVLLIRDWMTSMDYPKNTSIYVGPFKTVGSQIRGEYTNMSRVSGGRVPTEVIRMQEIKNFIGICAVPEYCGTFNCSFLPLYKSLQGLLAEPMPAPVSTGTYVFVQCLSPSDTLLNLKCDSYGKFNPRPDTPSVTCRVSRKFSREREVPDNKPIRKTCDCHSDGTESCLAVEGGFRCQCKKGWRKFTCWKSDDFCWVPAGNVNKCNGHGRCHSYPDLFVCECDPGFGGATCNLNVTNVTWFGSDDSVPFWTVGKAVTVAVTGVEWAEMFLKAALKSSGLISSDGPSDPLSYTSSMRKFTVAAAGVGMILYGHPHFYFDLFGFGCRLVFLIVNIAMLFAFWLLIMESYTTFTVYCGLGRNRWILGVEKAKDGSWCEVDEPEDKWFLSKQFIVYLGVIYSIVVEFYLVSWFFDRIPSPYTCLGEINSLRSPATLVNLEIMAAMTFISSGFGILTQVIKRLSPEIMAEQISFFEFHKGRTAIEVLNKVERCQYLQLFQAPAIYLTYAFSVWSQDNVATGLPQTLEFYFSIPLISFSVLVSAFGVLNYSPFIYGHAMKFLLPRFPWLTIWSTYTPAEHGYLSHSEVINRKQGKDVVLPENKDWPKHPSEKAYIAIERRHQCLRRLTRQYLEMRLMGVVKNDALELIAGRFLLAIPEGDTESTQWEYLLKRWTRDVRRMDGTNFEIPRNRAETRERYWNRVMDASLFTRADVLRENADWMRFLYLFQLLGHIPLEKANGPRSCQQIRHHSQCAEYRAAWDLKKDTENWPEIAMIISPELFPNLEKIQKVRGGARQKHTILVDLPAVKRYLWADFLNRAFFGWEQVQIRNSAMKNQQVEEPIEHRLEQIRIHVLERRHVPRTITHLGRAEWLAGHDLITIYQPSAPILIGANDQPREAVNIPPLIVEREGIPTSLYRW